jgi:hypothetical protein
MYCKMAARCGARPGGILTCPVADTVSPNNMSIAEGNSFLSSVELRNMTLSTYKNISYSSSQGHKKTVEGRL